MTTLSGDPHVSYPQTNSCSDPRASHPCRLKRGLPAHEMRLIPHLDTDVDTLHLVPVAYTSPGLRAVPDDDVAAGWARLGYSHDCRTLG
jgi:hypothetical protein